MLLRFALVPLALLILTVGAAASEDHQIKGYATAVAETGDPEEATKAEPGTAYRAYTMAVPASLAVIDKLETLIAELVASGDLTEEGAAKLKQAFKEFATGAPQLTILGEDNAAPSAVCAETVGGFYVDAESVEKSAKAITLLVSDETTDDEKRVLTITVKDGEVTMEGEGYSEEELAEIRKHVEVHGPGALTLEDGMLSEHMWMPFGDSLWLDLNDEEEGVKIVMPDEYAEHMKQMRERLKQMRVEIKELDELGELKGLELELQDLPELSMRLYEGMIDPESLERLKDLKEFEHLDLRKLEELDVLKNLDVMELDEEAPSEWQDEISELMQQIEELIREFVEHYQVPEVHDA